MFFFRFFFVNWCFFFLSSFLFPQFTKASEEKGGVPSCREIIDRSFIEENDLKSSSRHLKLKHVDEEGHPLFTNRLIHEPSFYLRSHTHNPVNWYSWGSEAFEQARLLNRPVLLSIGYLSCHWCHVMAEESFFAVTYLSPDEFMQTLVKMKNLYHSRL